MPVQVAGLTNAIAIAMGTSHAVALRNDGTVWTWGYNFSVSSGREAADHHGGSRSDLTNIVAIAAGTDMTLALPATAPSVFRRLGPLQRKSLPG
jgi:alpha-tubulin suppressor-like RCC1 family protein